MLPTVVVNAGRAVTITTTPQINNPRNLRFFWSRAAITPTDHVHLLLLLQRQALVDHSAG